MRNSPESSFSEAAEPSSKAEIAAAPVAEIRSLASNNDPVSDSRSNDSTVSKDDERRSGSRKSDSASAGLNPDDSSARTALAAASTIYGAGLDDNASFYAHMKAKDLNVPLAALPGLKLDGTAATSDTKTRRTSRASADSRVARSEGKPTIPDTPFQPLPAPETDVPWKPPLQPDKPPVVPEKPPAGPEKPPAGPEKPPAGPEKPPVGPEKPPAGPEKPPVGPEKPPVGPEKPPVGPDKPSVPDKPPELVNTVTYPNGHIRNLGRDDKGNVNDIITKDKEGKQLSRYVKDGDKWYFETPEGMRAQIQGTIQVNAKGDVSFETGKNSWRTERNDGTVAWEKTNSDGSRVSLTKDGKPERITRQDGSFVDAQYDKGRLVKVTETDTAGKTKSWQKDGDVWKTQPASNDSRKNVKLDTNGVFTYDSSDGFRYNITGDGTKLVEDLGLTTKRDERGRVQEVTYPGGKKVRTFGRDEQGSVNSVTTRDEKGERTFVRDGNKWFLDVDGMHLALPGNLQVSAKGDVSFETKPGVWRTEKTNGAIVTEKANDNGSRVGFTPDGKIEKIVRKDGSTIEQQYTKDGKPAQITEYSANGADKKVWVNKGDRWESHPGKEQRKNFELLPNGITMQQGADGHKLITLGDGRQLTERQGGAKFAFDKQGRFEAITYPDGDSLAFKYDANGKIKEITKAHNGAVVKADTRMGDDKWESKDGSGKKTGTWDGDYSVNSAGEVRYKINGPKNKDGFTTVIQPDGAHYQEKLNSDGTRTVKNPDRSTVEIDKDGLVRKVSTSKENYRTFDYDDKGQLSKVTDFKKGKEVSTWSRKSGQQESRLDTKIGINGELTYRTRDGKAVIEKGDQSKVELDPQGYIMKVTQPGGATREFQYRWDNPAGEKNLMSITDRRKSGDKEIVETWNRKTNTDGSLTNAFVNEGKDGKARTRTDVNVGRDGDYEYKTTDGKAHIAKAGKDRTSDNGFSASVEEARERLVEQMEAHLDEPSRKRFEQILDRFERRAKERVEAQTAGGMENSKAQEEWEQKVAKTYDHLSHMLTNEASGAPYDLATRAKLVENCAFAMAWPAKANDQGNWGCCWQISGVYLGVIQHPDKMAKMLDELSTSGKFTDTNGKTWTPPAHLLKLTDQGGNWTIGNCGQGGRRSPCSEIWTSVAAYLSQDGNRQDRGASGGTMEGCMHSMKLITGDTWRGTNEHQMTSQQYKQDMLLKGGVILFHPGHMYLGMMEKNNGQWQIVSSLQHGDSGRKVQGVVSDLSSWRVDRQGGQYRPDIPDFPGCTDKPIGPKGPDGPNGPDRPRPGPYGPWGPQPQPFQPQPFQPQPFQPQPFQPQPFQPQPFYPNYGPNDPVIYREADQRRASEQLADAKRRAQQEEEEKERKSRDDKKSEEQRNRSSAENQHQSRKPG